MHKGSAETEEGAALTDKVGVIEENLGPLICPASHDGVPRSHTPEPDTAHQWYILLSPVMGPWIITLIVCGSAIQIYSLEREHWTQPCASFSKPLLKRAGQLCLLSHRMIGSYKPQSWSGTSSCPRVHVYTKPIARARSVLMLLNLT